MGCAVGACSAGRGVLPLKGSEQTGELGTLPAPKVLPSGQLAAVEGGRGQRWQVGL